MQKLLKYLCLTAAVIGVTGLPPSAHARGFSTVVIDAGHGGIDRGGIPGQRASEKNLALDVARRLQACLREEGLRTVMTRTSDVFVPLPTRVAIANSRSNAILVSIHFNSSTNRDACGFETYYCGSSAAGLAVNIQRNILSTASTENRGVKSRGFYVLRKTRVPAVLVECGFLTNRDEAQRCEQARYRQRLAREIAEAITDNRDRLPEWSEPSRSKRATPHPNHRRTRYLQASR